MRVFTPGRAGWVTVLPAVAAACVLVYSTPGFADDFDWTTYLNPNRPVDAVLHDGAVWLVSTTGAVTVYDISQESFSEVHRRPGGLASNSIRRILVDNSGVLWFGTSGSGVSVFDPLTSQWDLITSFDGLPSDVVQTMAGWGDSVWVGTPSGFAVFSEGALAGRCNEAVPPGSRCPLEDFSMLALAPLEDGVYLGTEAGVSWFDGEVETPMGRPWGLGTVKDLLILEETPWVLTAGGVYRWDSAAGSWVDSSDGLPGSGTFRRLVERDGTVYTAGSFGVYALDGDEWSRVGSVFDAVAVAGSYEEGLWAAGRTGLYSLSEGVWTKIEAAGPLFDDARSVAIGGDGEVWVTGPGWVSFFDGESWEGISALTSEYRLQGCDTYGLLVDSQNRVWFGHCCSPTKPDSCRTDRLIRSPGPWRWRRFDARNVWRVAEGAGSIWLAGRYDGLYRLDGGTADPVTIGAGEGRLSSNLLSSIVFDSVRGLWIGHRQEGVDLYRGALSGVDSDWDHIDESVGLVSNSVRKVLLRGDQLWVGTLNGVSVVDPVLMGVVRNYTVGPGGIDDRITDVSGLAVDGVGDVWVSTQGNGVYLIHEDGTVESFKERNSPLTNDTAKDVAYDPFHDVLWITTSSGVNRVARATSSSGGAGVSLYVYPNPYCPGGCNDVEAGPLLLGGVQGTVDGEVVDVVGRIMARFFDAGNGDAIWDGTDASGRPAGTGLYFVIVRSGSDSDRAAVALVR